MQTVLKIMPEPIAEVPRDTNKPRTGGHSGGDNERFDSVYEQQLHQNNHSKDSGNPRTDGNDPQQRRQLDDQRAANRDDYNNVSSKDSSKGSSVDSKADAAAQGKADSEADSKLAAASADSKLAAASADSEKQTAQMQAKSAFDQLVGVMEKSGQLLRQTNGAAADGNKGAEGGNSTGLKHNKLALAIDSVLTEREQKLPETSADEDAVGELIKASLKGQGKGENDNPDIVTGSRRGGFKPSTPDATGRANSAKLDAIQTPGIIPDLKLAEGSIGQSIGQSNGKPVDKPGFVGISPVLAETDDDAPATKTTSQNGKVVGQTSGINPTLITPDQAGANGGATQTTSQNGKVVGQTSGINPTLITPDQAGANGGATKTTSQNGKVVGQTSGINPTLITPDQAGANGGATKTTSQNGKVVGQTSRINPTLITPDQAGGNGGVTKTKDIYQTPPIIAQFSEELAADAEPLSSTIQKSIDGNPVRKLQGDGPVAQLVSKNVVHDPLAPTKETPPDQIEIKPFELADGVSKSFGKLFAGQESPQRSSTAPLNHEHKAGKLSTQQGGLAGMMQSDEKSLDNIIGTVESSGKPTSRILNASAAALEQAQAQKANPEGQLNEKQLSDKKLLESLSAENKLNEEVGLTEERPAKFMPKDINSTLLNKGQSQFTAINSTSLTNTLNSTSATDNKMTGPDLTKLQQAMTPNQPDFSQNMKERLTIMMNRGVQSADIRLDPAELGQMQVKMTVENDVTSVSFTVQNSQAKEVLEQAMPKLKEMLAEQGLEMGEGSVNQEDQQQALNDQQQNEQGSERGHPTDGLDSDGQIEQINAQQMKLTNGALGGIDFFA
ncbi:MAG: flagellar hook-length control protein FliK [Alteromonadaceae bacterium]|jgi:flagellar hook-length control protein FliK